MNETFKPCRFPEYQVSNLGRVKRVLGGQGARVNRCLSPHKSSNGYLQIRLTTNGEKKIASIHGLVAEVFLGPRPAGMQVRHLDGNKKNNFVCNLAYGTAKENGQDNARLNVMPRGERVNTNVLTVTQAKKCFSLLHDQVSPTQVAKLLNVPRNAVYKIKYGQTWKWLHQANNRAEGKATL
jgi:hypothetical protein